MIKNNDWRLIDQDEYLFEKDLFHIPYHWYQSDWDHDHCEFCNENIDATTPPAYCTTDYYYWICEECFSDFKDMFNWTVIAEPEGYREQFDAQMKYEYEHSWANPTQHNNENLIMKQQLFVQVKEDHSAEQLLPFDN
jgi:hypothetical protein